MPCTHNPCTITCAAARSLIDWLKHIIDMAGDIALAGAVLLGGVAINTLPAICTT